jgi:AraC-like DNA-binding protein
MDQQFKALELAAINKEIGGNAEETELLVYDCKANPSNFLKGRPFRSKHFTVLLLIEGKVEAKVNHIGYELHAGDVFFIPPSAIRQLDWDEQTTHFRSMLFSLAFLQESGIFGKYYNLSEFLKFGMKSDVIPRNSLKIVYELTYIIENSISNEKNNNGNIEVIKNLFRAVLIKLKPYFQEPQFEGKTFSNLIYKFIEILNINYKSKRELSFYAERLFVNEKYLSQLLKKKLGKTARQLVTDMVIMEAKILLDEQVLSVKQIACQLNFENPFHFSSFFKKYSGLAPKSYRDKVH